MLGFLIGTISLVGLVKVLRGGCGRGHCHGHGHGHGRCGGHRHRCHHGGGHGGFGPRRWLNGLFDRLGTSAAQEKVIVEAAEEVRRAAEKVGAEVRQTRPNLASALRSETLDATELRQVFARAEVELKELPDALAEAVVKIHAVLDESQRQRLARWLESGGRFAFFGGGPYRNCA
ncbi:MAG: periplasmic heavy metal sensor [Deltaproteobacteria bacterium]|nr:periplasmic heavy metal sensor [Deltaproteobacteria bacterium]